MEKEKTEFTHKALDLNSSKDIVFLAMSKKKFYFRRHAVKFAIENNKVPISQYGIFDYFLLDTIDRDKIRTANNVLMKNSDELWVIGPISDGVLAEIKLAKKINMPIKYFKIIDSKDIKEAPKEEMKFEEDLEKHRSEL